MRNRTEWSYEQTKLLIAVRSKDLDLSSYILGSYPWLSSRLKDGDDNRGSHTIRRHFVSHCEVTMPIVFEFSQDVNRTIIEQNIYYFDKYLAVNHGT